MNALQKKTVPRALPTFVILLLSLTEQAILRCPAEAVELGAGRVSTSALPANQAKSPGQKAASFAFVLDVSGSMSEGNKLTGLKESTKLAVALLDGQLTLIPFSDSASPSQPLPLTDADSRRTAMGLIDKLNTDSGTNYMAALRALSALPKDTVTLFVSDGENTSGRDADVLTAVKQAPGPIYTVGVETTKKAQELLTKMAATSGGASAKIDSSQQLTEHLLKLAQCFGHYRSHTPPEEELVFLGTNGGVIAIGYGALPGIDGTPALPAPPFQHRAKLPQEDVLVSRVSLTDTTNLTIQLLHRFSADGRLARVLRNDQPHARLTVEAPSGTAQIGSQIVATTEFFDSQGNQIDPRTRPDLVVGYQVQDAQGQVLARVPAKPSPTKPVVTGTLPLPNTPGPVTVVQGSRVTTSSGQAWDAFDQQTILVKEQATLTAEPSLLAATADVGKFRVSVELRASDPSIEIPDPLRIELQQSTDIQLLRSRQSNQTLEFEFEATQDGDFAGRVVVTDPSSNTIAPLSIPFQFHIKPRFLGLTLDRQLDLGTFHAAVGQVSLPPIPVQSLDDQPTPYSIRLTDLSNGASIVALNASGDTVSPTAQQPASVGLKADIADVPPGKYTGIATFVLNESPQKTWSVELQLVVIDSLGVKPIDFGQVEPGAIREATLALQNHGGPLQGLTLASEGIEAEGGLIELAMPDRLPAVPAKSSATVPIKLAVSPLVTSRGLLQTVLRLRRTTGVETTVPVRLTMVDPGRAPSPIVISPSEVQVTAKAGDVVQFNLSIKLGPGASSADQLDVETKPLSTADGTSTAVSPEFRWSAGNTVTTTARAILQGFLVAPDKTGEYRGEISIKSGKSGVKTVKMALVVE